MRLLARTILLLLLSLPVVAVAALWLCFEDTPSVARELRLTPQDVERAKRVIDRHDPRNAGGHGLRTASITGQELDLIVNYAASRFGRGAARATIEPGSVRVQASAEIARSPFGPYLNVDAVLGTGGSAVRFERLRIGGLPVPSPLADFALRETLRHFAQTDRGGLAADVVKDVRVTGERLVVRYVWSGDLGERARSVLLSATEQARLRAYQERLVETVAGAPDRVSLATLMPPLFRTVLERAGGGGDVAAENRAAILVLAFYANGTGLAAIAPAAARWAQPARRTVTLAGRGDFPKHFLVSAAISAEAGGPLADAVGVHKEIEDSRGGSGFSFNDIAADRAGTRFGEIATAAPERARRLAQALADGVVESDFMPDVADLPEFLPRAEFERRYGGVGGPGYEKVMARIEARVASRPLLR